MAKLEMKPWTDRRADRDPRYKVYCTKHEAAAGMSWRRINKAFRKADAQQYDKLGRVERKIVSFHRELDAQERSDMGY